MQAPRTKAILSIGAVKSTDSLSLVAGILLLLLLLIMNYPSTGVVRGDDEGSGIGGTGRAAQPGSGLGGTGLKPFLSLSTQNEIEIMRSADQRDSAISKSIGGDFEPEIAAELTVVEPLFKLVSDAAITRDSSAITIAESVQHAANTNAVYFQQLQQISDQLEISETFPSTPERNPYQTPDLPDQPQEIAADLPTTASPEINDVKPALQASDPAAAEFRQLNANNDAVSWESFALFLTKNAQTQNAVSSTAAVEKISITADSAGVLSRPDKIQRPELPPVQRLRPIQRASILPPRVQPLRL